MPSATTRDAREGYEIFHRSAGATSLDSINDILETNGYRHVSNRMYAHYRNLYDAGYDRYMPINRFDVSRSSYFFEYTAASGRYLSRDAEAQVVAIINKANSTYRIPALATEVSDVGATLSFPEPDNSSLLRKARPALYSHLVVESPDSGLTFDARIDSVDLLSSPIQLGIEYQQLVSVTDVIPDGAVLLPERADRFVLAADEQEDAVDVVSNRIVAFFELIEGARSLINSAGTADRDNFYVPPPSLEQLRFESPLVIEIFTGASVLALLSLPVLNALLKAAQTRESWKRGTTETHKGRQEKVKADRMEAKESRRSKDSVLKKDIDAIYTAATNAVVASIRDRVRDELPASNIADADIDRTIREYIVPPIESLAQAGVTELRRRRRRKSPES